MINFIGRSKIWISISAIIAATGIVALFLWGLNLSIDFTGGSLVEIIFDSNRPEMSKVSTLIQEAGIANAQLQPAGDAGYIIRSGTITEDQHQNILTKLKEGLPENQFREDRFESIGPIIGNELKMKSIWSIIIVLLAIIAYIAYAFRKVSKPVASWMYGVAAIIALIHDLIIVVGLYAIISHYTGWGVDSLFITALLTILGFSVHDTIVTFDRTRETLRRADIDEFDAVVNTSINATLSRSINTSLTTLLVLLAIFFFGGETIKHFIATLIIGIIIGTYSSIFIASPILVFWNRRRKNS